MEESPKVYKDDDIFSYKNHRGISQASKLLAGSILRELPSNYERFMRKNEAGFGLRRGFADQLSA